MQDFLVSHIHKPGKTDIALDQQKQLYLDLVISIFQVINLITKQKQIVKLDQYEGYFTTIALIPLQRKIVIGGSSKKVLSINLLNSDTQVILQTQYIIQYLSFSNNGKFLGIMTTLEFFIYFWQERKFIKFPLKYNVRLITFTISPNSSSICIMNNRYNIQLYSINSQTCSMEPIYFYQFNLRLDEKMFQYTKISFNENSNLIALPGNKNLSQIKILSNEIKNQINQQIYHSNQILNCYWYNLETIITIGIDRFLIIWNYKTSTKLVTLSQIPLFIKIIKYKSTFLACDDNGKIYQFLRKILIGSIKKSKKKDKEQKPISTNHMEASQQIQQKCNVQLNESQIANKKEQARNEQFIGICNINSNFVEKIMKVPVENQKKQKQKKSVGKKVNKRNKLLKDRIKQINKKQFLENQQQKQNFCTKSKKQKYHPALKCHKQFFQNWIFLYSNQIAYILLNPNNFLQIRYLRAEDQQQTKQLLNKNYIYFDVNYQNVLYANNNQFGILHKNYQWTKQYQNIQGICLGSEHLAILSNHILYIFDFNGNVKTNFKFQKRIIGMLGFENLIVIVYENELSMDSKLLMDIFIYNKQLKILIEEEIVAISNGSQLSKIRFSFEGLIYSLDNDNKLRVFSFQNRNWENLDYECTEKQNIEELIIIGFKNYYMYGLRRDQLTKLKTSHLNSLTLNKITLKISLLQFIQFKRQPNQLVALDQMLWKRVVYSHEKFRNHNWYQYQKSRQQTNLNYLLLKTIPSLDQLQHKLLGNDSRFAFYIQFLIIQKDFISALEVGKLFINSENIKNKMIKLFKKADIKYYLQRLEIYYKQLVQLRSIQYKLYAKQKKKQQIKNSHQISNLKTLQKLSNKEEDPKKLQLTLNQRLTQLNSSKFSFKNKIQALQRKATIDWYKNGLNAERIYRNIEQQRLQIKIGTKIYKQSPKQFIKRISDHIIYFREFHKKLKNNLSRITKCLIYRQQKTKKLKLQLQQARLTSLRLKMLKEHDMNQYIKLVQETKNKKINKLLQQTTQFLKELGLKVLKSKGETKELISQDKQLSIKQNFLKATQLYYQLTKNIKQDVQQQPKLLIGGKLKNYQITGLQWLISLYNNNLNGILADEMGLGKTVQVIALMAYLIEKKNNLGPFLIIVPLSTVDHWIKQFTQWCPCIKIIAIKGEKSMRSRMLHVMNNTNWNVCITTYQYITIQRSKLSSFSWNYIIIDESHKIKSKNRFKSVLIQDYISDHRLVLTGTPLQNNIQELWNLLNFLLPTVFNYAHQFNKWFRIPLSRQHQNVELNQQEKLLILNRLHQVLGLFLFRRIKKEVQLQIPQKKEQIINVQLSGLQKFLYQILTKKRENAQNVLKITADLRKMCNHPYLLLPDYQDLLNSDNIYRVSGKFQLLDRILPKLFTFQHRILIFSQMTTTLTMLGNYLNYKGIKFLRLDGSLKIDKRTSTIDQFNKNNSIYNLMLISTKSGGLGLNLQTADTVILFDSDWNPQADIQAQSRVHRIGQKKQVLVLRFVTNTWIELDILEKAEKKKKMDSIIIQSGCFNQIFNQSQKLKRIQSILKQNKFPNNCDSIVETPNDQFINKYIARDQNQFETFNEMDLNRYNQDKEKINKDCRIQNVYEYSDYQNKKNNYRLMQESQIQKSLLDRFLNILNMIKSQAPQSQTQENLINEMRQGMKQQCQKIDQLKLQQLQSRDNTLENQNGFNQQIYKSKNLRTRNHPNQNLQQQNLQRIRNKIKKSTDKKIYQKQIQQNTIRNRAQLMPIKYTKKLIKKKRKASYQDQDSNQSNSYDDDQIDSIIDQDQHRIHKSMKNQKLNKKFNHYSSDSEILLESDNEQSREKYLNNIIRSNYDFFQQPSQNKYNIIPKSNPQLKYLAIQKNIIIKQFQKQKQKQSNKIGQGNIEQKSKQIQQDEEISQQNSSESESLQQNSKKNRSKILQYKESMKKKKIKKQQKMKNKQKIKKNQIPTKLIAQNTQQNINTKNLLKSNIQNVKQKTLTINQLNPLNPNSFNSNPLKPNQTKQPNREQDQRQLKSNLPKIKQPVKPLELSQKISKLNAVNKNISGTDHFATLDSNNNNDQINTRISLSEKLKNLKNLKKSPLTYQEKPMINKNLTNQNKMKNEDSYNRSQFSDLDSISDSISNSISQQQIRKKSKPRMKNKVGMRKNSQQEQSQNGGQQKKKQKNNKQMTRRNNLNSRIKTKRKNKRGKIEEQDLSSDQKNSQDDSNSDQQSSQMSSLAKKVKKNITQRQLIPKLDRSYQIKNNKTKNLNVKKKSKQNITSINKPNNVRMRIQNYHQEISSQNSFDQTDKISESSQQSIKQTKPKKMIKQRTSMNSRKRMKN